MAARRDDRMIKAGVLAIVCAVPAGRVTTYRDIGEQLGLGARQVAYQLGSLTPIEADTTPWHRVVGDEGWLGAPKADSAGRSQDERLADEGVTVSEGRVAGFEILRMEFGELADGVADDTEPAVNADRETAE